jgi:hypothetical protein
MIGVRSYLQTNVKSGIPNPGSIPQFQKFETPPESTIQAASDSSSEHCLGVSHSPRLGVLQTAMAELPFWW